MGQYGKNFYGASYYGLSGVFAGQFISDKTKLENPIENDGFERDGTLSFDITATLPRSTYYGTSIKGENESKEIIANNEANWNLNEPTNSISTTLPGANLNISLTCSDMTLNFVQREVDGAEAEVIVIEYDETGELSRQELTIDTSIESSLSIENNKIGNYTIEVHINSLNPGGVLDFVSIEAVTGDISIELNHTTTDLEAPLNPVNPEDRQWSGFNLVDLVKTHESEDTYTYSGKSSDIQGAIGYLFKVLMASSDDESSPEITSIDISTSNVDHYSDYGYWKALIDLGEDFDPSLGDSIDSISYIGTEEDGSHIELFSRTTEDSAAETELDENISWGEWSPSYSSSFDRVIINLQSIDIEAILNEDPVALADLEDGYITGSFTTPVIEPENLTNWKDFFPNLKITDKNPLDEHIPDEGAGEYIDQDIYNTDNIENTFVEVNFLNPDFSPIIINQDPQTIKFKYQDMVQVVSSVVNKIHQPMRVQVKFFTKPGYPTVALDGISLSSNALYVETKDFLDFNKSENEGRTGFEGYSSLVFNENTGDHYVYLDGKQRTTKASIGNMGFTVPSGAEIDLKYSIKKSVEMPDSVALRWVSGDLETSSEEDILKAEAVEDQETINKHRYRGSGVTLKIEDGQGSKDSYKISNVFYPLLDNEILDNNMYAFYLQNGFDTINTINNNVDIRWRSEDLLEEAPEDTLVPENYRRYVSLDGNEFIDVSIISSRSGNVSTWTSEESILDGVLNIDSPVTDSNEEIEGNESIGLDRDKIPTIDKDAIIQDEIPYKIEIVDNSIVCEGQIKHNSNINIGISSVEYSEEEYIKYDAKIVKSNSNKDFVPGNQVTKIVAINNSEGQYKANNVIDYKEGIHFTLHNGYIDWTLGIDEPTIDNETLPQYGDEIYINYMHREPVKINIEFDSNYNRKYYDRASIYRTDPIIYSGKCSEGVNYKSPEYKIKDLWNDIPDTIDKESLILKVNVLNNDFVNAYIDNNRVVGTLGFVNPKEDWMPHLKSGFYNIGKDNYYLFTNPGVIELGKGTLPSAKNIDYGEGINGQALLIQEETTNLLENTKFYSDEQAESVNVFNETFGR